MTLKQTFSCDPSTGINKQLADAYDAGKAFVVSNYATLEEAIEESAEQGKKIFTAKIPTTYKEASLRLKGNLMVAYFSGIYSQLGDNHIFYPNEVKLSIFTPSATETDIQFDFTF